MHKDFLSPDITKKDLEYVHISAKERDIANDLIVKGYLKRKQCRNLEKINVENFYELDIPFRGVNTLATGSTCKQYQISRMTTTNAYIGVYILYFFQNVLVFLWLLLTSICLRVRLWSEHRSTRHTYILCSTAFNVLLRFTLFVWLTQQNITLLRSVCFTSKASLGTKVLKWSEWL